MPILFIVNSDHKQFYNQDIQNSDLQKRKQVLQRIFYLIYNINFSLFYNLSASKTLTCAVNLIHIRQWASDRCTSATLIQNGNKITKPETYSQSHSKSLTLDFTASNNYLA